LTVVISRFLSDVEHCAVSVHQLSSFVVDYLKKFNTEFTLCFSTFMCDYTGLYFPGGLGISPLTQSN